MSVRLSKIAPLLLLAAITLAACAAPTAAPTPTAPPATAAPASATAAPLPTATLTPVHLKIVMSPFITYVPFYIAQQEGYFAEQGLEVEFVTMDRASQAIPLLAQGQVDVVPGTVSTGSLSAIVQGANLKYVADKGYLNSEGCASEGFVARKALLDAGQLTGPADLAGRVATGSESGATTYFLDLFLQSAGLSYKDMQSVTVPNAARVEAMRNGSIDLVGTTEPSVTQLIDAGVGQMWKPYRELYPNFQWSMVLYGPTLLEKNPDAGRRLMIAYLKAVRQYNLGKTPRNLELVAAFTQLDQDLVGRMCWPSLRSTGEINVQSIVDYADWAVKAGLLDQTVTAEQIWDPSFIQAANQALGQ